MAQIKKGEAVTLSTTEEAYDLTGDLEMPVTTVTLLLVSGTLQYGVAPRNVAPILDNTFATYSTAGDKIILTMQPGMSTLRMRCVSAGVVNVSW